LLSACCIFKSNRDSFKEMLCAIKDEEKQSFFSIRQCVLTS